MRRLSLILGIIFVLITLGTSAVLAQRIHVVQPGETLFRVALRYGQTVDQVAQANGLTPPYLLHAGNQLLIPDPNAPAVAPPSAPAVAPPSSAAPAPQTSTTTYTVQRGESLAVIAARFGINYLELAQLNNISNPDILHVGQVLIVPGPPSAAPSTPVTTEAPAPAPAPTTGTYTVQGGDSLSSIAAQFNINYFELASLNGIANPDILTVGMVLRVPGRTATARTSTQRQWQPTTSIGACSSQHSQYRWI